MHGNGGVELGSVAIDGLELILILMPKRVRSFDGTAAKR